MKKLLIFFLCFFAVQSIDAQGLINQGLNVINKKKQEQELKEKQAAENLKQAEAEAKKVENRRKTESSFPHLIDSTSSSYVKGNPFANQFHKDNVGKIFFSTTVTTNPEKLTAKSFTDTILFGQEIDVRYFLPTSICNYLVYDSVNVKLDLNKHQEGDSFSPISYNYVVIVTINGKRIEKGERLVKMDEKKLNQEEFKRNIKWIYKINELDLKDNNTIFICEFTDEKDYEKLPHYELLNKINNISKCTKYEGIESKIKNNRHVGYLVIMPYVKK